LVNTDFHAAELSNADLTDADVRGANFHRDDFAGGSGITPAQLYSTASYQARDLTGIVLQGNDLTGVNFAGQNLGNGRFESAKLDGADLSRANLASARFDAATLTGANLSHANLTNASFNFYYYNLAGADFSGADARGASFQNDDPFRSATTANFIRADGHIAGLDLMSGASLTVRNYHGNPATSPPTGARSVVVDQHLQMDSTGALRLVLDADPWDSTISFAPGVAVALGGTLDLSFAGGVRLASQWHRTIRLFDWRGVSASGTFNVRSPYLWDLSELYTGGEVTLAAFSGDANADGIVDFEDLVALAQHYNVSDGLRRWSDGDFTSDGNVDFNDLVVLAQNYGAGGAGAAGAVPPPGATAAFATDWAAALPEPSAGGLIGIGAAVLGVLRPRRR
jgi:hypothetical protein